MDGDDDIARAIVSAQMRLAGERGNWESLWQEVADRCCPRLAEFQGARSPGERRTEKLFDSTATLALESFAAAIMGMIAPRDQMWQGLRSGIPELDRIPSVQRYFEAVRQRLFYHRYAPRANFSNQFYELLLSLGAFGTGGLWVDEVIGEGLVYRTIHLSELYIEENHHGRVDTVYRRASMPARLWARRWGKDRLPHAVREALNGGHGEKSFEFIHALRPNADHDEERIGSHAIESIVVAVADRQIVSRGGFRTMPMLVSRFTASPRETYGRGPAMQVLPDIKMVNEMSRTLLRAAHRAVEPALLVHDDGVMATVSLKPNSVNVGGLDYQGRELVKPLMTGGSIPVGMEMIEAARATIEKGFLVPLFEILTDAPDRMTATQVLERAKEKGVLLSPAAGKIEGEVLGPMTEREIDILAAAGKLPDMPPELIEARGEYRMTYDNPLQRAAQAEGAIGFLRTVEALAPIAQVDPGVFRQFDYAAAARGLAEVNAVPPSWLRDPAAVEAEKQAEAQQQQAMQILQGAEVAGNAAKSLAQAQEMAGAADL